MVGHALLVCPGPSRRATGMPSEHPSPIVSPEQFAVDVFSELPQETIQRRWSG